MIESNHWFPLVLYGLTLLLCVKPLGLYIARVYEEVPTFLSPYLRPLEEFIYKTCGINAAKNMPWSHYALALLSFNFGGFVLLFSILLLQDKLPLNPQNFPGQAPDLAFNTAVSFITNTNWQNYSGEESLSYFSQTVGLTVQNFLSAAGGLAVLMALIRSFSWKNTSGIGNFWADLIRGCLYIFLPLALLWTILLGSQGVVQTFDNYVKIPFIEPPSLSESRENEKITPPQEQVIAVGPAASQVAIKQLGTNGGGFFNTNSAHPFENPTPLSNFFEMVAILLIPTALCYTFGTMVRDTRQGWALLTAMTVIFIPLLIFSIRQESAPQNALTMLAIDQIPSTHQPGGHMEGKETRFGIANSVLWAAATTATSNGSVNSMYDSFTPLGGMVPLIFLKFSEIIYGGIGSGLYTMLIFVIIAVFVAGLMVGRTPEYLGKKIQAFEMKMACVALLIPSMLILVGTAIAVSVPGSQIEVQNPGAQGFSEVLYGFASASNNNGSRFSGFSGNGPFYNTIFGLCMLFGRYWVIVPVLAIAGSFASKNTIPASVGTLPTHTPLFILFLISTIILVCVLTFAPALALGPIAQHLNTINS